MILFDKLITEKQVILDKIFSTKNSSALLVTYLNQHCFNTYFKDTSYKKLIDDDFVVYSEGIGMKLFFRVVLKKRIKRIDATFLFDIMEEINSRSENIFLVGGNFNEVLLNETLKQKGANLTGYQNGYFKATDKDTVLRKISSNDAAFIIIGMGVPKQEIFAGELKKITKNKIIICVGNFLEFYFGRMKRAPAIFQRLGLEWFFRLLTEPGRLWKRYIIGIPEFLYRIIKIKLDN